MSKSTFRILFYVRKNQLNKEGKAGIMIRLTINGDTSQFSSRLEVDPSLWDVKSQKMSGSSLKARQFNSLLDDVRTSLKNHFHDIETYEAYVTAEKVRNAFLGGKNGKLDPLKTDEGDHLKFLLQKSVKLFIGNGV